MFKIWLESIKLLRSHTCVKHISCGLFVDIFNYLSISSSGLKFFFFWGGGILTLNGPNDVFSQPLMPFGV